MARPKAELGCVELSLELHPDKGGNVDDFERMKAA